MELYAQIISIEEMRQMSETFVLREMLLDCSTYEQGTGRRFENILRVQAINAKVDLLNGFKEGERVKVKIYPNGRFYEKDGERKHSQNLNLFKIEKA